MKATSIIGLIGLIIITAHLVLVSVVLTGDWKVDYVYWLTPMLTTLSFLIIFATQRASRKDSGKTAITYSMLSVVKLLAIAITILVLSKLNTTYEKVPIMLHTLIPAALLLVAETLLVKRIISGNYKKS